MRVNLLGRRWQNAALALVLPLLAGFAQARTLGHDGTSRPLITLQTVRAIRSLSSTEAERAYPVRLRATVVFYDATINQYVGTLFVHDSTGGLFVQMPAHPVLPLREGTVVEVSGVSARGGFAPIVDQPHIRVVGQSRMPSNAPLVSLTQLLDGTYDSQWVQVEGVVHSVVPQGENIVLRIATDSGSISATTIREPGVDYTKLIDAKVHTYAVAASSFNKRRQLGGVHLFFSSMRDLTVVHYGPFRPFDLPTRSINQLSEFGTGKATTDRVHLQGTVTLQRPGQLLCIQDATGGLCVDAQDKTRIPVGTVVDVVGFRTVEDASPKLTDAVFRTSGRTLRPPSSVSVSATEALEGNHTGELVALEGEIAGLSSDPREPAALIASGGLVFSAVLPSGSAISDHPDWRKGSKVRVLGVCSAIINARQMDERQGTESYVGFRILMRSPEDLLILQHPSWWTPLHAILALSVALVGTLAVLGWAILLHRRVRQQTGIIQESEKRYRHLAYHDPLTGLPNRALLQLRLNSAIERAAGTQRCLALLLLDLDGFKQTNDSRGHDFGDTVLRLAADRIRGIVQGPNTAARMGGDEFVIVLVDIGSAEDACSYAEDIRQSMSTPFQIGGSNASFSCSIGISILNTNVDNAHSLLKRADAAMYQAKTSGRNQYRLSENDHSGKHLPHSERPLAEDHHAERITPIHLMEDALG